MIVILDDVVDGVSNRLGNLVVMGPACRYEKLVDLIANADKVSC